jgi:hypothetical protein
MQNALYIMKMYVFTDSIYKIILYELWLLATILKI